MREGKVSNAARTASDSRRLKNQPMVAKRSKEVVRGGAKDSEKRRITKRSLEASIPAASVLKRLEKGGGETRTKCERNFGGKSLESHTVGIKGRVHPTESQ